MEPIEISCIEVRQELTNYIEDDVSLELRAKIDEHLRYCGGCRAIYDGVRNLLRIVGTSEIYRVPQGLGERLYSRIKNESQDCHSC